MTRPVEKTVNAPYKALLKSLSALIKNDAVSKREKLSAILAVIEFVRSREVKFFATFVHDKSQEHYKQYQAIFRQGKAKQISKLEDVLKEVHSRITNEKFCTNTINQLMENTSHEKLQKKMDDFKHNGSHKPKKEWILLD